MHSCRTLLREPMTSRTAMSTVVVLSIGVAIVVALPIAWRVRAASLRPVRADRRLRARVGRHVRRPADRDRRTRRHEFLRRGHRDTLDEAVLLGLVGAVALRRRLRDVARDAARGAGPHAVPRTPCDLRRARRGARRRGCRARRARARAACRRAGSTRVGTFFGGRSEALNEIIEGSTIYLWYGSLVVGPGCAVAVAVALSDRRAVGESSSRSSWSALRSLRTVPTGNRVFLIVLVGGIVVFVFLRMARRPGVAAICLALCLGAVRLAVRC